MARQAYVCEACGSCMRVSEYDRGRDVVQGGCGGHPNAPHRYVLFRLLPYAGFTQERLLLRAVRMATTGSIECVAQVPRSEATAGSRIAFDDYGLGRLGVQDGIISADGWIDVASDVDGGAP